MLWSQNGPLISVWNANYVHGWNLMNGFEVKRHIMLPVAAPFKLCAPFGSVLPIHNLKRHQHLPVIGNVFPMHHGKRSTSRTCEYKYNIVKHIDCKWFAYKWILKQLFTVIESLSPSWSQKLFLLFSTWNLTVCVLIQWWLW